MNPTLSPLAPFMHGIHPANPAGIQDGQQSRPPTPPHVAAPWFHQAIGSQIAGAPMQRYREMTIDELLLENRVVFLVGEINYASATRVIMSLLYLQSQKKGIDINLYINSHGGSVDDTLAIYDTINFLGCDVATYCIGRAQSGGAIVLAAGKKGKRYILPHARVMIHQPYGGVTGQASDIQIQAEEILKNKATLIEILAKQTGKTVQQVEIDSERDRYFSAEEAKAYGIVDDVLYVDNMPTPPPVI
jgi:ATP-dependent Clp protease protease subunit